MNNYTQSVILMQRERGTPNQSLHRIKTLVDKVLTHRQTDPQAELLMSVQYICQEMGSVIDPEFIDNASIVQNRAHLLMRILYQLFASPKTAFCNCWYRYEVTKLFNDLVGHRRYKLDRKLDRKLDMNLIAFDSFSVKQEQTI